VDETYIKVKGQWVYLYRAVDKQGRTVDFLLILSAIGSNRSVPCVTPNRRLTGLPGNGGPFTILKGA
jgi:hypothetical protein